MDVTEHYIIFENRLASFSGPQPVSKGKGPGAARAPKTLQWPHKSLAAFTFAKAGFFFEPHAKSPDNVVCFLCHTSLDGWKANSDPLEEHLRHSPTCGWAIMAAIEAGFGNYGKVHPLDPVMVEARKATFAGRWPYESKRGFKCKTKKLVESGWKFTPSIEADDMTTCAYCHLALEGWESDDNPFDEHYRREPGCLFFALINQYPAPKKGRARAVRASKDSRLSVQSVATVATAASDLASAADITADHDDSVMTSASTMAQTGKKTTRGRKAATGRGRKTKANNDEPIEVLEDEPQVQEEEPKPVTRRGRKRASDAMEDPAAATAEAPAPKKRTMRTRASSAVANSSMLDTEMADAAPAKAPASKRKGRASTATASRRTSRASVKSQASTASLRGAVLDDDELDRQLEADLERYHSEAEEAVLEKPPAPARGRPKKAATTRKASGQKKKAQAEASQVLDPTPNEAEIEADLQALQTEMDIDQSAAADTLVVPKRGRKAGTRKASRQKKTKEPAPEAVPAETEETPAPEPAEESEQPRQEADVEADLADPDVSTGTVVTKPAARPSLEKRGRGRPKKSTASQASADGQEQRLSTGSVAQAGVQPQAPPANTSAKITRKPVAASPQAPVPTTISPPATDSGPATSTPTRREKTLPALPSSATRLPQPPSTPRTRPPPSARANQAVLSPAHSPQSSDAENRPPPLQPAASVVPRRVALAPVPATHQTPQRTTSPFKRNLVAGLQSTHPWQPSDLELLFFGSSPVKGLLHDGEDHGAADEDGEDKENGGGGGGGAVARLLRLGSALTSAERKMTVEEWIYHNAGLAEQKLKAECEAMVSAFEREGCRAMRVLEGLVVDA